MSETTKQTIMATATVEVELDLDLIPDEAFINELCERLRKTKELSKHPLTEIQKKRIYDEFLPLMKVLKNVFGIVIIPDSIYDTQKLEHLAKVFDQYSLNELILLLPNKGFRK